MYDTIILGAGWAGAVAAKQLSHQGYSVLVLEARDRIGGRARTWVGKKGDVKVDLGCSWIHGYNEGNPARKIASEFGVTAHLPKPAEGVIYGPDGPLSSEHTSSLRASLSSAQASFKTPYPSPPPSASLASALFSPSSPLYSATSNPAPSTDLTSTSPANPQEPTEEPSTTSPDKPLVSALARTLEIPLGVRLEDASLRWSGWESDSNFAGSDAAPEGGYEALVAQVLRASKAEVKLSTQVVAVTQLESSVVQVTTAGGEKYTAKTVISTIPLGVLKTLPEGFFTPSLPPKMIESIKGTHVGTLEKLLLRYETAWWPNATSVGSYTFLPTLSTSPNANSTPLEIFQSTTLVCANFAAPSLPGPSPTLLTYLSPTPAELLLKFPAKEVVQAYHDFLVQRFGSDAKPALPVEYELTDWLTDEFSRGATTTPSIVSEKGERSPMDFKELGKPVWGGKLGFAGEHTDMDHRGSVAGAVVSGQREAERIARLLAKAAAVAAA